MAYSIVGIVNLALNKIGAKNIAALDENTPNAIKAKAVWDYILDEILAEEEWRFAKVRAAIAVSSTEPVYSYSYAYTLPSDFIRLTKPKRTYIPSTNPADYYSGLIIQENEDNAYATLLAFDSPVWPPGYSYIIEELEISATNKVLALFTDYYNADYPLKINYIRRETNPAKYFPLFINALSYRLAAELSINITEDPQKFNTLFQAYTVMIKKAKAFNNSLDFISDDETGSNTWVTAGRT